MMDMSYMLIVFLSTASEGPSRAKASSLQIYASSSPEICLATSPFIVEIDPSGGSGLHLQTAHIASALLV